MMRHGSPAVRMVKGDRVRVLPMTNRTGYAYLEADRAEYDGATGTVDRLVVDDQVIVYAVDVDGCAHQMHFDANELEELR